MRRWTGVSADKACVPPTLSTTPGSSPVLLMSRRGTPQAGTLAVKRVVDRSIGPLWMLEDGPAGRGPAKENITPPPSHALSHESHAYPGISGNPTSRAIRSLWEMLLAESPSVPVAVRSKPTPRSKKLHRNQAVEAVTADRRCSMPIRTCTSANGVPEYGSANPMRASASVDLAPCGVALHR